MLFSFLVRTLDNDFFFVFTMQSATSILPASMDNIDILNDSILLDDSSSMMDLEDTIAATTTTSRRLSSVSHGTTGGASSMMKDEMDDDLYDAGMMDFGGNVNHNITSQQHQATPQRHRIVSLETGTDCLRQRFMNSACSINIEQQFLPELAKIERPDLGMLRDRRSSSDPSSSSSSSTKLMNKQHQLVPSHSPCTTTTTTNTTTMTLIAANRHHANAAAAGTTSAFGMPSRTNSINSNNDSSDMLMSSGDLAEACKEFGFFDSANSNSLINNKSTTLDSKQGLFSTRELATLCTNFPTLVSLENQNVPPPPPPPPAPTTTMPSSMSSSNMDSSLFMSDTSTLQTLQIFLSLEDTANSTTPREVVQQPNEPQQRPRQEEPQARQDDDDDDDDDDTDVVVPTMFDVKCGRGGDTIQHNGHFIDLCEAMAEAYQATGRRGMEGKQGIIMSIINAIHAKQGRFIKQDSGVGGATTTNNGGAQSWQVLPLQGAIDKTSHCIRDILSKRRKNEQQQQLELERQTLT
jgi:hypothetical protein